MVAAYPTTQSSATVTATVDPYGLVVSEVSNNPKRNPETTKPSAVMRTEASISDHYSGQLSDAADSLKHFRAQRRALLTQMADGNSLGDVLDKIDAVDQKIADQEQNAEHAMEKLVKHTTHMGTLAREQGRLSFEFHKHLSTLGTASILLGAAVVRGLFPNLTQVGNYLLILFASFACLLYSIVLSVLAMYGYRTSVLSGDTSHITEKTAFASVTLFSFGIVLFAMFTLYNLDLFPFDSLVIAIPITAFILWIGAFGESARKLRQKN